MMNANWKNLCSRLCALVLALMLALPAMPAFAQEDALTVTLSYVNGNGETAFVQASPLPYAGFESYLWAYLPQDADFASVTLQIEDASGRFASYLPENGSVLSGLQDAGMGVENAVPVEILCLDGSGQQVGKLLLYVSAQAEMAQQPSFAAPSVTVRYVNQETGEDIQPASGVTCALAADTPVYAQQIEGYTLQGSDTQVVTVDAMGNASAGEVVFYYLQDKQAEPPVIQVKCFDADGNVLMSYTENTVLGEQKVISAPAIEGYTVDGSGQDTVDVYADGTASKYEVTFYYAAISYTAPEISVICVDIATNEVIHTAVQGTELNQNNTFYAPELEGYNVEGSGEATVYVNEKGEADAYEVTFYYTAISYTAPEISVICVDIATNEVIHTAVQGTELNQNNTFYAPALEGYNVEGSGEATVYVNEKGEADAYEVTFYYTAISYTAPEISVICVDIATNEVIHTAVQGTELNQNNTFYAPELEGYNVEGSGEATVYVNEKGEADAYEVTFYYTAISYTAPEISVICVDIATNEVIHTEKVPTQLDMSNRISAPAVQGYMISGSGEDYVNVSADGQADKTEVTFYYQAVTAPRITVNCVNQDTNEVIHTTSQGTELNQNNTLYAPALEGYVLAGSGEETVFVDELGQADKTEVTFYYQTVTHPVVSVRYVNEDSGEEIRPAESFEVPLGESIVLEAPEVNGYTRPDQLTQEVSADADGNLSQSEVVFQYKKVPVVALVNILYRVQDEENTVLYTSTEPFPEGNHTVQVDMTLVNGELYQLADTESKQITVDENGDATPGEVVFYFRPVEEEIVTGSVNVYYRDESNNHVASPQTWDCIVGRNTVEADPIDLKEGYELISEEQQYVDMAEDGSMNPAEVVFIYRLKTTPEPEKTQTPAPQLPYDVTPMDTYCYPQGDDINFRSWPTTGEDNVIRTVKKSDLVHITGSLKNDKGEEWYEVEIVESGDQGYLRANVVRLLSQDEINALMGYTQAPTPEVTPAPTEVPDNAAIDMWGKTNDSVRFRQGPSTDDGVISTLKKNTAVWIYNAVTKNQERWYKVNVGGSEGYVMAKFVDLMSREDSDDYQNSLSTPMATQSPQPTKMPTTEVTKAPTPEATEEPKATDTPAPTDVPEPYRGYALTTVRAALRTGASKTDESILETVEENTLVLISAQTWVQSECWDNVEVISSGNVGFMQDAQLRHINNEEAKYYLDNLKPTPSPSPEPTQTPAPVSGYAITLGDNVMLRAFADTNAQILSVLPVDAVVMVYEQEYVDGQSWHVVNAGAYWGYIRYDQVRMMTESEVSIYLESLKTPTPVPESSPTPAPVTDESLSSYGYVNKDKVNMRSGASTSANRIRLLDQYAFALVLGTETGDDGKQWYHVSQAGTEGYIAGQYFTVLTLGELSDFLTSDEYQNSSNNNGSSSSGSTNVDNMQSVEDYNTGVWQNPALSASYEPFNPYATATPNPEAVLTATATPTLEPTATPTVTPEIQDIGNVDVPEENAKTSGNATGIIFIAAALVLGGGAAYAYSIYRKNERRRQAVREQQMRQSQARASQQPMTRAAQNNPAMPQNRAAYPGNRPQQGSASGAAPFMPPSGAPRPTQAPSQQTGVYNRAGYQNPQAQPNAARPNAAAQSNPYRPQQTPVQQPAQQTAYRPLNTDAASADPQATQQFTRMPQQSANAQAAPGAETHETVRRNRRSDRYKDGGDQA